jgi:hypothetical protein
MKLQCPECRKLLPSIGRDVARPGDTIQCGLCLHVWIPVPRKPLVLASPESTACHVGRPGLYVVQSPESSGGVTPAEIEMAKRYLARSVAAGLTSAPVVIPPMTDVQFHAAKLRARGLNTHGRPRAEKSPVPGVSARIVRFLDEFLKVQEEQFTIDDFQNFLGRSGKVLSRFSVSLYLQRFAIFKRLTLVSRGHRGSRSLYQRISAPEKDTATRQLASCNGASIPARSLSQNGNQKDEVQHGAAPRGQSRLQTNHTLTGPSAQNHGRSAFNVRCSMFDVSNPPSPL